MYSKLSNDLPKNNQNFDNVIRQMKIWHKYKTKPAKIKITNL